MVEDGLSDVGRKNTETFGWREWPVSQPETKIRYLQTGLPRYPTTYTFIFSILLGLLDSLPSRAHNVWVNVMIVSVTSLLLHVYCFRCGPNGGRVQQSVAFGVRVGFGVSHWTADMACRRNVQGKSLKWVRSVIEVLSTSSSQVV